MSSYQYKDPHYEGGLYIERGPQIEYCRYVYFVAGQHSILPSYCPGDIHCHAVIIDPRQLSGSPAWLVQLGWLLGRTGADWPWDKLSLADRIGIKGKFWHWKCSHAQFTAYVGWQRLTIVCTAYFCLRRHLDLFVLLVHLTDVWLINVDPRVFVIWYIGQWFYWC